MALPPGLLLRSVTPKEGISVSTENRFYSIGQGALVKSQVDGGEYVISAAGRSLCVQLVRFVLALKC